MKKFIGYFLSIILALGLGAFGMFYYMKKYPIQNETTTKIEKEVTVTDKGISEFI